MAIQQGTSAHATTTGTSLTFAKNSFGEDEMLLVGINAGASDVVSSVTYAGIAMIRAGFVNNGNSTAYLYYFPSPPTGSNNVIISTTGSVTIDATGFNIYGVKQAPPEVVVTSTANLAGSCANALTPLTDNSVHVLSMATDAFPCTSITNGTVLTGSQFGLSNPALITPPALHTMTCNSSGGNNNWAIVGASFAPSENKKNFSFIM